MKVMSAADVREMTLIQLGLPSRLTTFTSTPVLAAMLRRAAGFVCPCPQRTVVDSVARSLVGLVPESDLPDFRDRLDPVVDSLVAFGDLLEAGDVARLEGEEERRALLYAAPLGFVWRRGGSAMLLGIGPDDRLPLRADLLHRLELHNHVRRIAKHPGEDLRAILCETGLRHLSTEAWMKAPPTKTYSQHLEDMDSVMGPVDGTLPDLEILDFETKVTYYPARWRPPSPKDTGRYVARRAQRYGNRLWSYVELRHGIAARFVEFPVGSSHYRGCDQAWQLQMAIDAQHGHPQQYRLMPQDTSQWLLECFSPVPMWAQRRWDALGEATVGGRGRLLAYSLDASDVGEERRFLQDELWLSEQAAG